MMGNADQYVVYAIQDRFHAERPVLEKLFEEKQAMLKELMKLNMALSEKMSEIKEYADFLDRQTGESEYNEIYKKITSEIVRQSE